MTPVYRPDGEFAFPATDHQICRLIEQDRVRLTLWPSGKVKCATLRRRPGDPSPISLRQLMGQKYSFLERLSSGAGVWALKDSRRI